MRTSKEPEATMDDVVVQLKITNCLLAAQLRGDKEKMSHHDLVLLLASTGTPDKEVASLLGTTSDAVRMLLNREKHKNDSSTNESAKAKE